MATQDRQSPGQMTSDDIARARGKPGIRTGVVPSKGVPFTQEGLQNFLGPRFQVKPSRQGNFQVNIANMRASSDDDKLTLLYKARGMLRAQGFEASCKFTFRSQRTQRFENWPCLWVDQAQTEQLMGLTKVLQQLQAVVARLEQEGGELPLDLLERIGTGDAFEEDREIQPNTEDMEHQAMIQKNKHEVQAGRGLRSTQDPMNREPTLNQPSPGYPGDHRQHGGRVEPGRSPAPQQPQDWDPYDE